MKSVEMSPKQQERLQACLEKAAAILYADSDPAILTSDESESFYPAWGGATTRAALARV
ncbi:MAG: hypothetical protein AAFY57_16355 [Cyanobacteria bacterium J06642_2]